MWDHYYDDYLPDRPDYHRDSKVLMNHTPRDFMKIAHGVDPSLGRVQYLWDGWTIVHDHALEPQCGTVAVHPYWYKEQYLDDAF